MNAQNDFLGDHLIKEKDLNFIDSLEVNQSIKHRLRIYAHCLACFKSMAGEFNSGNLPKYNLRLQWCKNNPYLKEEESFIPIFLEQLEIVGKEIERISNQKSIKPLHLCFEDIAQETLSSHN